MADFLIKTVPIPIPRPIMEETVEGSKNLKLNWLDELPLPEMPPLDLSYPKVGTEYLLQPWYFLKRKVNETMELMNSVNIFDFANDWVELSLYAALAVGLGISAIVVVVGIFKFIGWITGSEKR